MIAQQTHSSPSDEAIRFYCGLGEKHYNHHPVVTGPYVCVSPVSGSKIKKANSVAVPQGVHVLQDSGAFNDACLLLRGQERCVSLMKQCRLNFKDALTRQEQHAARFGYLDQIEARASYDVLIDETWTEDASGLLIRRKKRWSETDADLAIEETIAAAAYLHHHRNGLPCILSAQGISPRQYLHCVERILPYCAATAILSVWEDFAFWVAITPTCRAFGRRCAWSSLSSNGKAFGGCISGASASLRRWGSCSGCAITMKRAILICTSAFLSQRIVSAPQRDL